MAVKHTLIKKPSSTSTVATETKPVEVAVEKALPVRSETRSERPDSRRRATDENGLPVKKNCMYCELKKDPTYTDVITLRKCMSERAHIMPKQRTGACSKHQRQIARQIKYARHLALLPFVNKI